MEPTRNHLGNEEGVLKKWAQPAALRGRTGEWAYGVHLEKLQQARCAGKACTDVIQRQVLRCPVLYHPLSSRFPFLPTSSHQARWNILSDGSGSLYKGDDVLACSPHKEE